jgi:two-component system cell cycle sensor histidine kinase/response regulator CckA
MFNGLYPSMSTPIPLESELLAGDSFAFQDHLFTFLLDNTPDRIYFKDTASRFLRVSKAMVELFEAVDEADVLGKTDFDFFTAEHAEPAFADEQEIMRTGRPMVGKEEKETLPDGRVKWAMTTKLPLRDREGRVIGTCGMSRDVTDKKRMEEQLLRAQRLESIGTLASGVAHDLNNILAPILMAAPAMRDVLPPEYESMANTIEKSAQRGADVIKQLLTFAKGMEGKRTVMRPKYLTEEIVEIARETFPKEIRIVHQEREETWLVSVDSTQMHQVLLNLCVNARDVMPAGGTLTVGLENAELDDHYASMITGATAGRYVMLSIQDTGPGIPPQIMQKIFDPFFTTKDVGKGTGLGLSTVSGIVKSHGGFVNVYSEAGRGAEFKVYLPACAGEDEEYCLPPVAMEQGCCLGNGEIILVVDDEAEIRKVTEAVLMASGYKVLTAADGTEALAIYAQRGAEIGLVLTDVMMPHFDGTALARTLKKMNPEVRIVACTGNGQEARVVELRSLNPEAVLMKPYTKDHLLKTLRGGLGER